MTLIITLAETYEEVLSQTHTISNVSKMIIHGTSNVNDWEAEVRTVKGEVVVEKIENIDWSDAASFRIEQVNLLIPVADIDSGSRRMNNNMYDYLKKSDHPYISYEMQEKIELITMGNPGGILKVRGIVTAAGKSVKINHEVTINEDDNGRLNISGSHDLKMTDFGIDPPRALLGTVRSHDEMTIAFKLVLE